jgi:hypothetical protein
MLPSARGDCPETHPDIILAQELAKDNEVLVALPDELR